jgi:FkbM family methyltransferase
MILLKRLYRALRYSRITLHPEKLAKLSLYRDLPFDQIVLNEKGRLVISGTNIELESFNRRFLLEGLSLVSDLRRCSGAIFEADGENRVVITVRGISLFLTCWEELFIAHEVLHRNLYNVALRQPFHVMDVGMNTATSALFFANMPECERVSGYELFRPTAERAMQNISLNPELSRKIKCNAYGLGTKDDHLVLDYFPEYKGSVGRNGLPQYAHPKGVKLTIQREAVEIRAVAPVLRQLVHEAENKELVCKVDCEGAEYEIMTTLAAEGLLNSVSVFLIEWHLRGPHEIKKLLVESGFTCLSLDEDSATHGMLYAFK